MNGPNVTRITDPPGQHFFGYYDKCPWDPSGRYVLLLETDVTDRVPDQSDSATVCLLDQETGDLDRVVETSAWNFQTGAMAQWLEGGSSPEYVFNDREDGSFVSKRYGTSTGLQRTYDEPIYTVSPDGRRALSINFNRLSTLRPGYGYQASATDTVTENAPDDDGVSLVNLESGNSELLVSLQELAEFDTPADIESRPHWVNHLSFSPDGTSISFLHRWSLSEGGLYTRLCTYDFDSETLDLLVDSGKVTHYNWRTPTEIVAWSRRSGVIGESAKRGIFDYPVVRHMVSLYRSLDVPSFVSTEVVGDQYHRYDVETGEAKPLDSNVLPRDGHPSFAHDGQWMVADTYPDEDNERQVYLYNHTNGNRVDIGSFRSPPEYKQTGYRCDLHPRWNRDGTVICIDSMHEGSRQMYTIDVSKYVEP